MFGILSTVWPRALLGPEISGRGLVIFFKSFFKSFFFKKRNFQGFRHSIMVIIGVQGRTARWEDRKGSENTMKGSGRQ